MPSMTRYLARMRRWASPALAVVLPALPLAGNANPGDAPASGYPPLGTEVMVPDLAPSTNEDVLADFEGHIGGPAVDTPTRPAAPAMASGPVGPIAPPPVSHLSLMLDWYPSPRHAALFVARALDMFASRELDVDIRTPADPDVPTKLLAASRVDLALTRQPLLHLLVDQGQPLVRVATLVGVPLAALVIDDDAGIEGPADLAGTRIGHADLDDEVVLLASLLARHDIPRDALDSPDLHFRLEQAMREGRVDGVIGAVRYLLPRSLADDGLSTRTYTTEAMGVPRYDGLILVANRHHLAQQRDAIVRLVDALEEATAWILENPERSWELLVTAEPALDTPTNRSAWPEAMARLSLTPAALHRKRYIDLERFLADHHMVSATTPVSRLAVDPNR
ncbi:ABC transporter substrate-binding protein [Halomonas organivorans]|uniref:Putative hydroxymethylpyrimidine transport system substrate-binding protein n=1 Tax=Halomonas organivorans TaxID=257772 RepID=A0A7W5BXF9_9GAMM|nr:ABC transporter substrate-binding protein [Halomonas organivorans]MBB3140872.1 putative hydroxymethylpyrimidine transport system substrate-binding protein [Halomonas organivorans]